MHISCTHSLAYNRRYEVGRYTSCNECPGEDARLNKNKLEINVLVALSNLTWWYLTVVDLTET